MEAEEPAAAPDQVPGARAFVWWGAPLTTPIILLLAVTLVATSCSAVDSGGSPTALPQATGPFSAPVNDACLLLPDMGVIARRRLVRDPVASEVRSDVNCLWTFNDEPREGVQLIVGGPDRHPEVLRNFQATLGPGEPVMDLGQHALRWPDALGRETLILVRGVRSTLVISVFLDRDDEAALADFIARTALSRLEP